MQKEDCWWSTEESKRLGANLEDCLLFENLVSKRFKDKIPLEFESMAEEEVKLQDRTRPVEGGNEFGGNRHLGSEKLEREKERMLRRAKRQAKIAGMRGVCYLSRVPPHMDSLKLRQILSNYGEIQRIYLLPENAASQIRRKRMGGFRGQKFSEGWVEFTRKSVAKRVANMLNGEQIGGKRRSSFYYDIWNIKYLKKFKWDDLTEEIANRNAIREQKLTLEISVAKKERDFYLAKVDQARALNSMHERATKKLKAQEQEEGANSNDCTLKPKVIRRFKQTNPVGDTESKPMLSNDILAGVFGNQ